MRSRILFVLLLMFFLTATSQEKITLMSYNIKLDYPKEGVNSWLNRKPLMVNQLKFHEPDIFGVQEAMPNQMNDLDKLLTFYSYIGVGRDDGKEKGEYSAIFYKKNDYKVLENSTFWLSETPNKVSMGWDAVCNRICTYALFQNKKSGKHFWVFNTHFDHVGNLAKSKSARLIIDKINTINVNSFPVILMGDFNMEETSADIKYLTKYLQDSKKIANIKFGPKGTFNGFHFDRKVTRRIDYVFVSDSIQVEKYAVISDYIERKYISDHLPVFTQIIIK